MSIQELKPIRFSILCDKGWRLVLVFVGLHSDLRAWITDTGFTNVSLCIRLPFILFSHCTLPSGLSQRNSRQKTVFTQTMKNLGQGICQMLLNSIMPAVTVLSRAALIKSQFHLPLASPITSSLSFKCSSGYSNTSLLKDLSA